MKFWKTPHISKVYEALTAIADSRIEIDEKDTRVAKCYSSSKGKFYKVEYDKTAQQIMSNDNSAYYTDTPSYPMIAFLMLLGEISYDKKLLKSLKGIRWKDINSRYKNDYGKAVEYTLLKLSKEGQDIDFIKKEVGEIYKQIEKLKLEPLGGKGIPPQGY